MSSQVLPRPLPPPHTLHTQRSHVRTQRGAQPKRKGLSTKTTLLVLDLGNRNPRIVRNKFLLLEPPVHPPDENAARQDAPTAASETQSRGHS